MTQFTLKLIALLAMVLDHTAKVLLPSLGWFPGFPSVQTAMVSLGRTAFPIFCWFVAEGCRKTKHISRYALRLLVFGVLSEIPFQLCFYARQGLAFGFHNVMFTMLLAVAAVWAGQTLEHHGGPLLPSRLLPACISIALGFWLQTDYNGWGVALILGLYYLTEKQARLVFVTLWLTVFQLVWHNLDGWTYSFHTTWLYYWLGSLLAVPLLQAYQGQRGRPCKWLFYVFYPAHLGLLWLLAAAIGSRL